MLTASNIKFLGNRQRCGSAFSITFTHTYSPSLKFNKNTIKNCLKTVKDETIKQKFQNKNVMITTKQSKNLMQHLTRAKFELNPIPRVISQNKTGLHICTDSRCFLHKKGYIKPCTEFKFMIQNKPFTWKYNRYFDCNSKNVIYMLKCRVCDATYIGQSGDFRDRTNNAKSSVRHHTSATVPYATHFNHCSNLEEPYFYAYPFYYENDVMYRLFKEWRMIKRFRPNLNGKL